MVFFAGFDETVDHGFEIDGIKRSFQTIIFKCGGIFNKFFQSGKRQRTVFLPDSLKKSIYFLRKFNRRHKWPAHGKNAFKVRLKKTAVIADKQAGGQHFHIISHGIMNLSQKQQILHILRLKVKTVFFCPVKKPISNINCRIRCRNCHLASFHNI